MGRAYTPQEWQYINAAVKMGYAQGSAIQWWDEGFDQSEKAEIEAALGQDHERIVVKDVIARYHERNKAAVEPEPPKPPVPPVVKEVQKSLTDSVEEPASDE